MAFNIGNKDQMMCWFNAPSHQTNHMKGESSICITNMGCRKQGFTVALCICFSGHKMPAFCVLKEPLERVPSKVLSQLVIPENI